MDVDSTAREVADLVAGFLEKFPAAREVLRNRLEQNPSPRAPISSRRPRHAAPRLPAFVIWTASADGPVRTRYTSRNGVEEYASQRRRYDIFVNGRTILLNGSLLSLPPRLHWLLIIFLRYRNCHIPPEESYQKAWGINVAPQHDEKRVLQDFLRFAVSGLRRSLRPLIDAGKLDLPSKRREDGYRCVGSFTFCIVLERTFESRATLELPY